MNEDEKGYDYSQELRAWGRMQMVLRFCALGLVAVGCYGIYQFAMHYMLTCPA